MPSPSSVSTPSSTRTRAWSDCLGEACLTAARPEIAAIYYRKALELDPDAPAKPAEIEGAGGASVDRGSNRSSLGSSTYPEVLTLPTTASARLCADFARWLGLEAVEYATLEWVHWYNTGRLLGPIGYLPPVEYEEGYRQGQQSSLEAAGLN